jgi:hypothetical protein
MNPENRTIHRCRVEVLWDSETGVWVASSDEVPGLVTEAQNLEALEGKLEHLVPELLLLNGVVLPGTVVQTVWVLFGADAGWLADTKVGSVAAADGAGSVRGGSGGE